MKKYKKKLVAVLLSIVMSLTVVPLNVFASGGDNYADLGTNFIGLILIDVKPQWKPITVDSDNRVRVREEVGHAKQLWRFERQSDGSYIIRSALNGDVLDAYNYGNTNGTVVQVCKENGSDAQKWYFYSNGDGSYYIKPKYCDLVLDMNSGTYTDGQIVQLWEKNGTVAQKWCVYKNNDVQLQATTLSVTAGNSANKTVFKWNEIYGESRYDIKIWKNKLYEGEAYHIEWGAISGYGIQLPAGKYQAYVDSCNYFDCKMSNTVTFTVADTKSTVTVKFALGENQLGIETTTSLCPSKQIVKGTSFTLPSAPTYNGYTFIGWVKDNNALMKEPAEHLLSSINGGITDNLRTTYNGIEVYSAGKSVSVTKATTYYAVYSKKDNIVNLDTLLEENYQPVALLRMSSVTSGVAMASTYWFIKVFPHSDWDYKNVTGTDKYGNIWSISESDATDIHTRWIILDGTYVLVNDEYIGNIVYGYTGQCVYDINTLLLGSDAASIAIHLINKEGIVFDDQIDKDTVELGFNYADSKH